MRFGPFGSVSMFLPGPLEAGVFRVEFGEFGRDGLKALFPLIEYLARTSGYIFCLLKLLAGICIRRLQRAGLFLNRCECGNGILFQCLLADAVLFGLLDPLTYFLRLFARTVCFGIERFAFMHEALQCGRTLRFFFSQWRQRARGLHACRCRFGGKLGPLGN